MTLQGVESLPQETAIMSARIVLLLAVLSVVAAPALAQQQTPELPTPVPAPSASDPLHELRTADGNKYIGRVISEEDGRLTFETITGVRMEVNRAFVRLRPAQGRLVDGEFWATDKHTTRLFFAPTGRSIPAGEGYVGMFWVLPFVGFGATDNITLAGGLPPVGDLSSTPVWLAPKVRVMNRPDRQASAGVFAIHIPGDDCTPMPDGSCRRSDDGGWFGIGYGIATFGNDDSALHVGAGVTFGSGDAPNGRVPVMVGGEHRIGKRTKLLTENWLIPGEGSALSLGWRRIGERWTWDYGWMMLLGGEGDLPYIPIISFSYGFGGR
jgi:hypothetical protein